MKKRIKEGKCPTCGKTIYRRWVMSSTKCNYCGLEINNFKEVFKPR
jgi:uncharacterized protein (DUF983 family)